MFNLLKRNNHNLINIFHKNCLFNFAQQSSGSKNSNQGSATGDGQRNDVKIDEKYKVKSAALYDKYLQSRQKPTISLDNYQINYCWILQRIPIFLPYNKNYFQYYKNRYQMAKKTNYYIPLPKDLIIEEGDYLFAEYEKSNPENIPTHEIVVNNETTYYRDHARYWRFTDPEIKDGNSIQAYSSDNVFFIVKNNNGEWIFPQRSIAQKQTHDDFFKNFSGELFNGQAYPNIFFGDKKPMFVTKKQIQNMDKGAGIKTFYFQGYSMSGITKFPHGLFKDYKWVAKPHLHKYFTEEYAKTVVRLAKFSF